MTDRGTVRLGTEGAVKSPQRTAQLGPELKYPDIHTQINYGANDKKSEKTV